MAGCWGFGSGADGGWAGGAGRWKSDDAGGFVGGLLTAGAGGAVWAGGAGFFTGSGDRCADFLGSSRGFTIFTRRLDLLNSSESWICASSSEESAASTSAVRFFWSSMHPASPDFPRYLTRIHLPFLYTSVPVPAFAEMLPTPENRDSSSSARRFSIVSPFLISRNVPLGSCIIVTLATFWYIVSFLIRTVCALAFQLAEVIPTFITVMLCLHNPASRIGKFCSVMMQLR